MRIPLLRALVSQAAIEAVADVLHSGWLGTGPRVAEFERTFADYLDVPRCVGLDSGTSALHLALRLLDLPAGAKVVTTPMTFVSTNLAILYEGLQPVFVDIQTESGNIDPQAIRDALDDDVRAIMVVHNGGLPCDLDEIYSATDNDGPVVVEDCAHAVGATYKGRRIGSHGDIHAFSFGPTKHLSTPGGGALTVRSTDHAGRLKRLRMLGVDRDSYTRKMESRYEWDYLVTEIGYRANMDEVAAAIALVALHELEGNLKRREEIAANYRSRLEHLADVRVLVQPPDRVSSNYLFTILVERRDDLISKLQTSGIEAGVHYRRNDLHPIFEKQDLPNAEWYWTHNVSLPMHLGLGDDDVSEICDLIEEGW